MKFAIVIVDGDVREVHRPKDPSTYPSEAEVLALANGRSWVIVSSEDTLEKIMSF